MKLFIILLLLQLRSSAEHFMRTWINWTGDFNKDPCDNFYRHVCPLNISKELELNTIINKMYHNFGNNKLPEIENTVQRIVHSILGDSRQQFLQNARLEFEEICTRDRRSVIKILTLLETIFSKDKHCEKITCLTNIASDRDCARATDTLFGAIQYIMTRDNVFDLLYSHSLYIDYYYHISYVMNTSVETIGASKLEDLIDDLKYLTIKKIKKTPWIINSQTTESYIQMIRSLEHSDHLDSTYTKLKNFTVQLNKNYEECMERFQEFNYIGLVTCMWKISLSETAQTHLPTFLSAKNGQPNLYSSLPLYFLPFVLSDYSAFMGLIGSIMAHEVGHSIIESPGIDNLMPYYSQETIDCIQDQFNTTCQYFKEDSCGINDDQIDENGADIFGNRIAYDLAFEHYGDSFYETVPELNITHQQLFFYAHALSFCNGELSRQKPGDRHSPLNIRINIVANLPEFQQAFQCSPDSKMVKSATKECIVIGENANHVKKV